MALTAFLCYKNYINIGIAGSTKNCGDALTGRAQPGSPQSYYSTMDSKLKGLPAEMDRPLNKYRNPTVLVA